MQGPLSILGGILLLNVKYFNNGINMANEQKIPEIIENNMPFGIEFDKNKLCIPLVIEKILKP